MVGGKLRKVAELGQKITLIHDYYAKSRTPQDMDGTLTLIFAKSETP